MPSFRVFILEAGGATGVLKNDNADELDIYIMEIMNKKVEKF